MTSKTRNKKPDTDLPVYQEPFFRVHYTCLEKFIKDTYGFEFNFLFAAGVTAGMCPEYIVTGQLSTTSWKERATSIRQGHRPKSISLLLNVMAHDGKIPKGQYTVSTHPLR